MTRTTPANQSRRSRRNGDASPTNAVRSLLEQSPDTVFAPGDVAQALGLTRADATSALHRLYERKLATRVGFGQYRAAPKETA